jgi:hypothetical protein
MYRLCSAMLVVMEETKAKLTSLFFYMISSSSLSYGVSNETNIVLTLNPDLTLLSTLCDRLYN